MSHKDRFAISWFPIDAVISKCSLKCTWTSAKHDGTLFSLANTKARKTEVNIRRSCDVACATTYFVCFRNNHFQASNTITKIVAFLWSKDISRCLPRFKMKKKPFSDTLLKPIAHAKYRLAARKAGCAPQTKRLSDYFLHSGRDTNSVVRLCSAP